MARKTAAATPDARDAPDLRDTPPVSETPDPNADVADLGYEQARDELFDIVARLESGQVELEESLTLWARGEALAAHCGTWLDRAQAAITDATT